MSPLAALAAVLALGSSAGPAARGAPPVSAKPKVHYKVECDPGADDPCWKVMIEATGLDTNRRDVSFELQNWGEWSAVADEHLLDLDAQFPIARDTNDARRFRVTIPKRWDGSCWVSYRIAVHEQNSEFRRAHGLLPRRTTTSVIGFTANTLMHVCAGDEPIDVEREIELTGPQDATIVSGFAKTAKGTQKAKWVDGFDNTLVVVGEPLSVATDDDGPVPLEVVQLGGHGECAENVLDWVRKISRAQTRIFGTPPLHPVRIVIAEPKEGGTRVDGAIIAGFSDAMLSDKPSPYTTQFVAHEMTHDWLGGRIDIDDGKCAWFVEGFTEYFSIWLVAATALADRAWFVERLTELDEEASKLGVYKTVAFTDPDVRWREGEVETLAYKAAPATAFALDAELRKKAKSSLAEMVREFAKGAGTGSRRDGKDVVEWLTKHGLAASAKKWITGKERPKPAETVKQFGDDGVPDEFFAVGE